MRQEQEEERVFPFCRLLSFDLLTFTFLVCRSRIAGTPFHLQSNSFLLFAPHLSSCLFVIISFHSSLCFLVSPYLSSQVVAFLLPSAVLPHRSGGFVVVVSLSRRKPPPFKQVSKPLPSSFPFLLPSTSFLSKTTRKESQQKEEGVFFPPSPSQRSLWW